MAFQHSNIHNCSITGRCVNRDRMSLCFPTLVVVWFGVNMVDQIKQKKQEKEEQS
jgi:hypothetical protein